MILTSILIGLALAADAFAVSVSAAACSSSIPLLIGIRAAFIFGLFQFLMPVGGWLLGSAFASLIEGFDHWIAFGLLAFVGGKMLYEAVQAQKRAACGDPEEEKIHGIMQWDTLLLLALATSIDALAVGLSYSILGTPILLPATIIGITTFATCLAGIEFGRRLKDLLSEWAEIIGGSVLLLIGLKILIEHLRAGR
ncbi:MAG: manganese efflux pump MntP family protein [Spirochaetaceae bacterium]|nr:manganese efflux pump MntP family protein [Spirochaetaceae bacterium]